jgi:hypothetical protein
MREIGMSRSVRIWLGSAALLAAVALVGCGSGGKSTASGTVKLEDGTPVTNGMIIFESAKTTAKSEIGKDGTFKLRTGDQEGAEPGSYKVFFQGVNAESTDPKAYAKPLLDPKFNDPKSTPLKFEVSTDKSKNVFDVKVSKAPAAAK